MLMELFERTIVLKPHSQRWAMLLYSVVFLAFTIMTRLLWPYDTFPSKT
jgi:hypothetical protein